MDVDAVCCCWSSCVDAERTVLVVVGLLVRDLDDTRTSEDDDGDDRCVVGHLARVVLLQVLVLVVVATHPQAVSGITRTRKPNTSNREKRCCGILMVVVGSESDEGTDEWVF